MAKRTFNTNIGGRVNKIKTNDFLVPLHEAISNSVHAIEASGKPGQIDVQIVRQPRQTEVPGTADQEAAITGFVITDDGIGFDDDNMDSFCEADSQFKAKIGGKGVERFSWLKFFERASVESVFECEGVRKKRTFSFSTTGIDDEIPVEVTSPPHTTVRLNPLHVTYEPRTRKSLEDVSIEIVEHFIAYLVTGSLPPLRIRDGAATQDIGELYRTSIGKHATSHRFVIKGNTFDATGIRFFLGNQAHTGFLCGDKRVAERIAMGKRDPFFSRRFLDLDLKPYAFHVFVQSAYLDRIVHDDRDGFRFPEPGTFEAASPDAVTKDEIADCVLEIAHDVLADEIMKLKAKNIETVASFVAKDAPQYRRLVTKQKDAIANIHENDPVKLDQALRRIQFEGELKTRAEISALMKKAEEVGDAGQDKWKQQSAEVLEKLSEEGKASLAAYIVQRKLILDR